MMKFLLAAVNAKYIHSNPGIYSLKRYGEQFSSVRVELAEYTINNRMDRILEDLFERRPEVVGFSCYIWNIEYVLELVRDLHKVLPETDIWLGGPEVSFDAPGLLRREPEVFGVMKGEGEETFAGLLKFYEELGCSVRAAEKLSPGDGAIQPDIPWSSLIALPNLTCRSAAGTIVDQPLQPVMDMDQIPFLYTELEDFANRIIYYESSRGCPFSCSYCLSSIDRSVRFRSMGLVKEELEYFLKNQVKQVKFIDRTFNCKKSHALEIWRYILGHDNGVTNFHFEIAADLLDEEELELIGRMRPGLIQLEIGVQSTNPDTIREIHRRMDLEQVKRVVARINAGHNVHQHLDLIAGLPYEDYESFRRSFNEVYAMEPEQLQLGFLKVLKGSYMYESAEDYDLVYRSEPPYEVLSTRWLPYADVLRLKAVEEMVEVYYNSRQFTMTLKLLEREYPGAFAMFEDMADHYKRNGLFDCSHSRMARYEILREIICRKGSRRATLQQYEDALMCDLYLRENAKSRPAFALDQTPFKEEIRKRVPELRSLGTRIHAEMLHSGELRIFDYRKKDPLTGNAAMITMQAAEG